MYLWKLPEIGCGSPVLYITSEMQKAMDSVFADREMFILALIISLIEPLNEQSHLSFEFHDLSECQLK